MAKLTTVYWRDIPAQVIAKERRETAKIVLTERFAEAIDKAAMRAKMAGTDAYLEQWRREVVNCGRDLQAVVGRDLQAVVDAAAATLEQAYDDARLDALVSNGGLEP
jgi:hypothetical protein